MYIDEKNYVNEHDSIFKNALFMLIEDYRENVRELIEEGEKLSDYYKKPKHKKKIKDYINSKLHCLGNISEIELTNYQKASIEYLEKNRDKNIAILLPT
ncbi:hypothetical protein HOG21_03675 [bacterium]|nr:hypothetical protein [bacterium]